MTLPPNALREPPRLLVRTLFATFGAMVLLLAAVFATLMLDTRARVTHDVAANLDVSQRVFAALEHRRQQEIRLQMSALAESPTLKAALDTWETEWQRTRLASPDLVATVEREVQRLASHVPADAVIVLDQSHHVLASAGPQAPAWPRATLVGELAG